MAHNFELRHHRDGSEYARDGSRWQLVGRWNTIATLLTFVVLLSAIGIRLFQTDLPSVSEGTSEPVNLATLAEQSLGATASLRSVIYSDTAIASRSFSDFASCDSHADSTLSRLASSLDDIVLKKTEQGLFYTGFKADIDNFVVRCVRVSDESYRLLVAGAGLSKPALDRNMRRIFEALDL